MNKLIHVQFYSPMTYTYQVPDEWPDDAKPGDPVLVPVGDHSQSRNYTEMWKVARLTRELNADQTMEAKSTARTKGFEIKKAAAHLGEYIELPSRK